MINMIVLLTPEKVTLNTDMFFARLPDKKAVSFLYIV